MPASPSDPEKYSIDQMMDRLKNSPPLNPEDGELVTRSDGTQAIRVRKRKRRSNQPHKNEQQANQRVRIIQVTAALVLVFIAALVVGGAIIYGNSSNFRNALVGKIEQASGASVELTQFRINPKTANAGSITLKWPTGNVLESLFLRGVNAEVSPSSFLGNTMTGEEVTSSEGILALGYPTLGEALRHSPAHESALPIRFKRYRVPSMSLTFGDPVAPLVRLTKSEASLNPETSNGKTQLSLYQGDVAIPGWPKLRLDRALVDFTDRETNVIGLRLLHETDSKGVIELSGPIFPYQPELISSLQVRVETFELSGIIGSPMSQLIYGRVDTLPAEGSNTLSLAPTEGDSPIFDVAFQVSPTSRIILSRFPFLLNLSLYLDDPWYQEPVFDSDATGTIHREKGNVTLKEINLLSKGRMACRGEIMMSSNQQLSGNLEIGIAEAMIATSKNSRLKSIFGPAKEGYRWLNLKISGPVTAPKDNFKDIFTSAGSNTEANPHLPERQGSSFEELTRPR